MNRSAPATGYDPNGKSSEIPAMQIRLGYELVYYCPQPTPMVLMLNVHYTRISDMVVPDHLVTSRSIPIRAYRDGFGNWCGRIVAPAGRTRLFANGIVKDTGEPDVVAGEAQQHAVELCPMKLCCSCWGAAIARPTGCLKSHGRCSEIRRSAGPASRQFATTFTSTLPSATNTRAPPGRRGKLTAIAPASAGLCAPRRGLLSPPCCTD